MKKKWMSFVSWDLPSLDLNWTSCLHICPIHGSHDQDPLTYWVLSKDPRQTWHCELMSDMPTGCYEAWPMKSDLLLDKGQCHYSQRITGLPLLYYVYCWSQQCIKCLMSVMNTDAVFYWFYIIKEHCHYKCVQSNHSKCIVCVLYMSFYANFNRTLWETDYCNKWFLFL